MKNASHVLLGFAAAALLVSCGPKNDKRNNSTNNSTSNRTTSTADMGGSTNSSGSDAGGTDAGTRDDAGFVAFGGCPDGITLDETFDLDGGENAGQFYARTAWDGHGAWVVYNRRESSEAGSPEEIFALRVGCAGDVEVEPIRLSVANGNRNYYPVIASRGDITQVAWIEDAGGATKTTYLAQLGVDGTMLGEPTDITPRDSAGEILSALAWEPDLAVAEDGSGVVALSTAVDGNFQIALQRFDSAGVVDGAAFIPFSETGVDQTRPTVALDADGTTYVAWTRYRAADDVTGTPAEPETVVMTSVPAGATMALPSPPIPAKPLTSPNPQGRFAREPMPDGAFLFAFQVGAADGSDLLVRNGSSLEAATSATFGSASFVNSRPSIAAGKSGGLLVWYRYESSPTRSTVMMHPFSYDGTVIPGSEVVVDTANNAIPPYGPDATWAGNNAYFMVWSEGASAPEARVKGRWVVIP